MKRLFIILVIMVCSCNTENSLDCFQAAGEIVTQEIQLPSFKKITVFERVQLIVKQGPVQKVVIESGKNLLPEITASIEGDRLIVEDKNSCNVFRDYDNTKVYVTSPNLEEIRNSSTFDVLSDGVLEYPNLSLQSEDYNDPNATHNSANFNIQYKGESLNITVNNISHCFISGEVTNLYVFFASGNARFEGAELTAQHVDFFQRSSNDIILNPVKSVKGEIRGTGDVILLGRPADIDVQTFYTGELIIRD